MFSLIWNAEHIYIQLYSEKYTLKLYNYWNLELILKHKLIKTIKRGGSLNMISSLISVMHIFFF
jgi:hypothetical protein